jgi:TPR repeat protein
MRRGAIGFFRSLFKRSGPATPVSQVSKDQSPEDAVVEAHKALQAVKRSATVQPEIDDALKRPIPELSRLDFMELRKLAHHAYHGIGKVRCDLGWFCRNSGRQRRAGHFHAGTPKDVHKATELWVCAAMKGCPESTYSVAMCFLEGKGCIPKVKVVVAVWSPFERHVWPFQDEAKAIDLLEQLVNHKHGWSMFALATILARNNHNKPDGDPQQLVRAVALYTAAAEANIIPAMKNLSNFHELGIGTPKDPAKALHWLTRAAKGGDPTAQVPPSWGLCPRVF